MTEKDLKSEEAPLIPAHGAAPQALVVHYVQLAAVQATKVAVTVTAVIMTQEVTMIHLPKDRKTVRKGGMTPRTTIRPMSQHNMYCSNNYHSSYHIIIITIITTPMWLLQRPREEEGEKRREKGEVTATMATMWSLKVEGNAPEGVL